MLLYETERRQPRTRTHRLRETALACRQNEVNNLPITMELDSGSCYSLLNSEHWKQLGKPELKKGPELRDVSRTTIPVFGIAYVDVRLKEQHKRLRVVFIDRHDTASLLSREWIAEFNLFMVQQATPQVSKLQIAQQTSPNLENLLKEFKDLGNTLQGA